MELRWGAFVYLDKGVKLTGCNLQRHRQVGRLGLWQETFTLEKD